MSDAPAAERPYQVDDAWSRAVFTRRSGRVGAFLAPHLRPGMRLIDCGCGPGSITVDLAAIVAPGAVIGTDRRENVLNDGRQLARERGVVNVAFAAANIYRLPYPDGSFHAAFSCAVLQHLADPRAALAEIRRVLTPDGVIGIVDGSSPLTFRYPTNPLLDTWDRLRALQRAHNTGRPSEMLQLRTLLREVGFSRTEASGTLATEVGGPAGSPEATQSAAQNDLIRLRGVLGKLALAEGWVTSGELEQIARALTAWGEAPDAFCARPTFTAIGWA